MIKKYRPNAYNFENKFLFYRNKLTYHDNSFNYSKEYGDYSTEYAEDRIKLVDDEIAKLKSLVTLWDGSETIAKEFDNTKKRLKEVATYGLYEQLTIDRLNKLCDNISDCIYGSIKGYVTQAIMQNAINEVTNAITGADGGYVRLNPPNNPSEILLLDNEDINEAKTVWRFNKGGIGVSNTGYNGEYLGLTKDGKLVINEATANKIDANFIKTQVIENISTGNNYFSITDQGAKFGNLATGNYTLVNSNGIKQYIANAPQGSQHYLRVAQVIDMTVTFPNRIFDLTDKQRQFANTYPNTTSWYSIPDAGIKDLVKVEFPQYIKDLLEGQKPQFSETKSKTIVYKFTNGLGVWDTSSNVNAHSSGDYACDNQYYTSNAISIYSIDSTGITFSNTNAYCVCYMNKKYYSGTNEYQAQFTPKYNVTGGTVKVKIMIIG